MSSSSESKQAASVSEATYNGQAIDLKQFADRVTKVVDLVSSWWPTVNKDDNPFRFKVKAFDTAPDSDKDLWFKPNVLALTGHPELLDIALIDFPATFNCVRISAVDGKQTLLYFPPGSTSIYAVYQGFSAIGDALKPSSKSSSSSSSSSPRSCCSTCGARIRKRSRCDDDDAEDEREPRDTKRQRS
jgi:hypothetical protein